VTRDDIRFAFTWQMMAGLLCAAAMYAAAPAIAAFFSDHRVEGMVQLLSLASLLMAAGAPATCLLQRDLNFRALGLIQFASYAAGYLAVGIPMALHGYGAYALGAACVVQSAVNLVGVYAAKPHPVRPLLSHAGGVDALSTGRYRFPHQRGELVAGQSRSRADRARPQRARGGPLHRGVQPGLDSQRVAGEFAAAGLPGRGCEAAG
jgi:O-antigen/teichoic acid export membrane protein